LSPAATASALRPVPDQTTPAGKFPAWITRHPRADAGL